MSKKQTLLVVDDDEATRLLYETILKNEGYHVLSAADGRRGLEMIQQHKPALVILDLMMPELHGVAVCEAAKGDPALKDVKILVVSVKTFLADRRQAIEAGADEFLPKPVDGQQLLSIVKNLLSR